MRIKVQDKQTIFDIALQYTGSIDAVNEILIANKKQDDTLLVGEELTIPNVYNNAVATYFKERGKVIATAVQSDIIVFSTQDNALIMTQNPHNQEVLQLLN